MRLKSCQEKQKLLKVASTQKSCSKIAEHNLDMTTQLRLQLGRQAIFNLVTFDYSTDIVVLF